MKAAMDSAPAFQRQPINSMSDAAREVSAVRTRLIELGFAPGAAALVATAVSELASNLVYHAGHGTLMTRTIKETHRVGFEVIAEDDGPGISDWDQACTEGYSTAGSLGLGLAGVLRIMDEVEFDRDFSSGTRIRAVRWRSL